MKKTLLVILLFIISLLLIVGGTVLYYSTATNKEHSKQPNNKDNEEIVPNSINENISSTYQYKNLNINNIVFKVQENQCLLEMTLVNNGTEKFYEKETKIIFSDDKNKVIGSEKIILPMVDIGKTEYILLEITNKEFFKASSFSLEEIISEIKEDKEKNETMETG